MVELRALRPLPMAEIWRLPAVLRVIQPVNSPLVRVTVAGVTARGAEVCHGRESEGFGDPHVPLAGAKISQSAGLSVSAVPLRCKALLLRAGRAEPFQMELTAMDFWPMTMVPLRMSASE